MAYLARQKSDRALSILLLERDPMSPIGEDRYTIAEANELDDRVPTALSVRPQLPQEQQRQFD